MHLPSYLPSHLSSQRATAGGMRFWRPVPRQVADIVCGDGGVAAIPLHAHEEPKLIVPLSPLALVDGRGQVTMLRPGLIHYVAPLDLYAVQGLDGASCAMAILLVSPELPGLIGSSRPGTPARVTEGPGSGVVDDPGSYVRLRALIDEMRGPLVALDCVSRLADCVAQTVASRADARPASAWTPARQPLGVARVRDHLRDHVAESLSLDELAEVAALSKFYLLRAFTRVHGVTPHAYQMLLRLARAWRLIGTGMPLGRATYDAGFADQSHLTRRFAELYGITPGRYARQLAMPAGASSESAVARVRAALSPAAA